MTPSPIVPTVGRVVLFVLPEGVPNAGKIRPAIVVSVEKDAAHVNLAIQLDGAADHIQPNEPNVRHAVGIEHDAAQKPGTYHWMDYQKQQAKAAVPPPPAAPSSDETPALEVEDDKEESTESPSKRLVKKSKKA